MSGVDLGVGIAIDGPEKSAYSLPAVALRFGTTEVSFIPLHTGVRT